MQPIVVFPLPPLPAHLLAISQKRTHATTAYIRKMNPYMKVLALKAEEEDDLPMVGMIV